MEPFPDIQGLEIFPGRESNTMEFKLSLSNIIKNKCISTICSFLNSKGGYIVFGVEDKDRRIVGIDCSPAELDEHLLWFDGLYHSKRITDIEGNKLKPGTLEVQTIKVAAAAAAAVARFVVVLTMTPEPGVSYKCQDGTAWHRLAASVYSYQMGSAEKEMAIMQEKLAIEKTRAKYALDEINMMRRDMYQLLQHAKKLDDQMEHFTKAVSNSILVKKQKQEQRQSHSLCPCVIT
jgi:hypothetical protein